MISAECHQHVLRIAAERGDDPDIAWLVDIVTERICNAVNPAFPDMRCYFYAYSHRMSVLEHHGVTVSGAPRSWPLLKEEI